MTTTKQEDSPVATTEVDAGWIQSAVERLARTFFGQIILGQLDRLLWVVEKSMEWSLPQDELCLDDDENRKSSKLVRPLPWILFLPSLALLRSLRVSLNVCAFIFSLPPIEPITVVKFMQKNRKRLRALKSSPNESPSRTRFRQKDKRLSMNEAKKALIRSIRLTLSTLSCLDGSKPSLSPPPTKIYISALDLDATVAPEEKSSTESAESSRHIVQLEDIASTISTDDSLDETLQEKIDRLALENSTDDQDFVLSNSSILSSDNDDNDSDNDNDNVNDLNVSMNEVQDITTDSESLFSNETIEQEKKPEQKTPDDDCDKAECDLNPQNNNSKETSTTPNQDGDAPFYSPISSTNSSIHTPERPASPIAKQNSQQTVKTNEFGNGEACFLSGSTMSEQSLEDTNNGVEKRGTSVNKHHHRGKRSSHGNRKKK